ncbi:hypothetical protein DFJ74DRAFT_709670 [Hyaloraphidium curvatum]|nr:hypothetical protein DFJ74DRAFT_709670 [Hyaloraphidium curvatum]
MKTKCVYTDSQGPCQRCSRLSRACAPPDGTLSRRKREKLRRAQRAAAAPAGSGSGDSNSPSPPPSAGPPPLSLPAPSPRAPASGVDVLAAAAFGWADATPAPPPAASPWPSHASLAPLPGLSGSLGPAPPSPGPFMSGGLAPRATPLLGLATATGPSPSQGIGFAPGFVARVPRSHISPDAPHKDVLLQALIGYWACMHRLNPLVHRGCFERAFLPGPHSPVYGRNPPEALLYALAANGTRFALLPGLSDAERLRCGKALCERARDAVLAGYYGHEEGHRTMTDFEALQTLFMMHSFWVPYGTSAQARPLLERLVEVGRKLRKRTLWFSARVPATGTEWIMDEMVGRGWISVAITDLSLAYAGFGTQENDYFAGPFFVPCNEQYFDMDSQDEAFGLLCERYGPTAACASIDLAPLLDPATDPAARAGIMRDLVGPTFYGRASLLTMVLANTVFRELRLRMRAIVDRDAIDPATLLVRGAAQDSPAEAAYRRLALHCDSLLADLYSSFPQELGTALAIGDPDPFFRAWPAYFGDLGCAHAFFSSCTIAHFFHLENHLVGRGMPPASVLAHPAAQGALGAASALLRLLGGQLADDPALRWTHFNLHFVVLRTGYLLVRALEVVPAAARTLIENEVRFVARVLGLMGRTLQPMGPKLAREFAIAAADVGVLANGGEIAVLDHWDVPAWMPEVAAVPQEA